VHLGVHALHREVGTLDQSHLDGGSSTRHARGRPFLEIDHHPHGIGQVGLEHDPGCEGHELILVEKRGEDGRRQVEIAVLLHVKVDERAVGVTGHPEERPQGVDDVRDVLFESPRVVWGDCGRHLE